MSQSTAPPLRLKSRTVFLCQVFSPFQSEMILFILCTPTLLRTEDKDMPYFGWQDKNTLPNHGVLVELWQESQEFLDQELTDQDRPHSVTCAEVPECSLHSRSGENGTEGQTSRKEDTLLPQPSPPPHAHHS